MVSGGPSVPAGGNGVTPKCARYVKFTLLRWFRVGDLAVHCLYISLSSDAKHCLSPVPFVFQAASAAIPGWFGEGCALGRDPDLWVLSAGAQVSHVLSPTSFVLAPTANTGWCWLSLGEVTKYCYPQSAEVYCFPIFFFKALLEQEPLPVCR